MQSSNLRKELNQAITAATEAATIQVLREHLGPSAIKQLGGLVKERPEVGAITVEGLLSNGKGRTNGVTNGAKNGAVKTPRKFGTVDLRDADVLKRFDAKVLMEVARLCKENEKGAEMGDIHERVGASVYQVRGAILRWKKARKIKSKGTGRGCRYFTR